MDHSTTEFNVNDAMQHAIICAICLDSIAAEKRCVAIDCMHQFCDDCLQQWLNSKNSSVCPLCNGTIKLILYSIKSDIDYKQRFPDDLNVEYAASTNVEFDNDTIVISDSSSDSSSDFYLSE